MEVMKPMSPKIRRKLTIVSVIFFVFVVPYVILYSSGYRFSFIESKVTSTGGIFVSLSPSGSAFSVDGKYVQSTGIFSNSFFEQDLSLGMHELSVSKDGYETWTKKIPVKANEVTEVNSLLIPKNIIWKQVVIGTTTSTTTFVVGTDQYVAIRNLFFGTSTNKYIMPISITTAITSGGISLWTERNVLIIDKKASNLQFPAIFCVQGINNCVSRVFIPLNTIPSFVDFYPNRSDVVIISSNSSVFAIEMDNHLPRIIRLLYSGTQPKVRVSNGMIYIKDLDKFFVNDQLN